MPCRSRSCRSVPATCVPKSPPSAAGWEEGEQPSPKPSAWREKDAHEGKPSRLRITYPYVMLCHQNFVKHVYHFESLCNDALESLRNACEIRKRGVDVGYLCGEHGRLSPVFQVEHFFIF